MTAEENRDQHWMRQALGEGAEAVKNGELPIAAILVAGDSEIGRAQTQTGRRKSMTGHAEMWALIEAQREVYSKSRPLTIFTTLEPCLMCLGAAMQCGVDEIVYAMPAAPDGGTRFASEIAKSDQHFPVIRRGVLEPDAVKMMQRFVAEHPEHPGIRYARLLVAGFSPI